MSGSGMQGLLDLRGFRCFPSRWRRCLPGAAAAEPASSHELQGLLDSSVQEDPSQATAEELVRRILEASAELQARGLGGDAETLARLNRAAREVEAQVKARATGRMPDFSRGRLSTVATALFFEADGRSPVSGRASTWETEEELEFFEIEEDPEEAQRPTAPLVDVSEGSEPAPAALGAKSPSEDSTASTRSSNTSRRYRQEASRGSVQTLAAAMPRPEASPRGKKVVSTVLAQLEFDTVRARLQDVDNCVLLDVVEQHMHGTELHATDWSDAPTVPGTVVRRIRFRMPLPTDVPSAVKKLVRVPDSSAVTFLAQLGCTDSRIVLVVEIQTPDAPFGTSFWVSETMVFTRHEQKGVQFEKWASPRWVSSLPWYASAVGGIIETNIVKGATGSGDALIDFLMQPSGSK